MSDHKPECDINDVNVEGIHKPCNCGAQRHGDTEMKPTTEEKPEPGSLERMVRPPALKFLAAQGNN